MRYDEKPSLDEYIYNMYSDAELTHYGTKMHSGRYPWGSGDEPYQHSGDFVAAVKRLKKEGLSEVKIAEHFGMKTGDFRNEYRAANAERRYLQAERARSLKEDGLNTYEIGRKMNIAEATVRELLDPNKDARYNTCKNTYNFLKDQFREHKFIDIGEGVERDLGISREMLDTSIHMLKIEGYEVYERHAPNMTNPGRNITVKTLCPPGTTYQDFIKSNLDDIGSVTDFTSKDRGETFEKHKSFVYPKSMDINRLQVRYADDVGPDGFKGIEKDGIIEIRRGVEDLSLGDSKYSQVRILVDNDRYLKGMAVYSDDMPPGVDVIFNTNKGKDKAVRDVLKKIETDDPDNPFGSTIKEQVYYKDKNGKEQLGLINKRADQGDWEDWSNALPSQFLAKQNMSLIKKQLNEAYESRLKEYNDICALENPTVKKALLKDFADGCDSASVHLKAASLPRQQYHVIVPINSLKDNEIYAPNYKDGEQVALIRYPHAGLFEIPKLTVNNKNAIGKKLLGSDVIDAVGINSKVAEQLSGADFDGDTVMVIPTNDKVKISNRNPLEGLKGFDPKVSYATHEKNGKYYDDHGNEVNIMPEKVKGRHMGIASNLITDMTLGGATDDELARAVRHSMVVIDAPKHKLDWKRSEVENGIKSLKEKYQLRYDEETGEWKAGGASTLLSRAKSPERIVKRQGTPKVNKKGESYYDPSKPEGALLYKPADDAYYADYISDKDNPGNIKYKLYDVGTTPSINRKNKEEYDYYKPVKKTNPDTGEVYFTNKTGDLRYNMKIRTQERPKMYEVSDANELVSFKKHAKELAYADYANKLKALANQARKEDIYTSDMKYNPSANKTYKDEVNGLLDRLNEVSKNQTRERQAQLLAGAEVQAKVQDNPGVSKSTLKKMKDQALKRARETVGAKRRLIEITDKEWEAIQAGAISADRLKKIFKYADMDIIRQKAMPKPTTTLTKTQTNKIQAMIRSGRYTNKQIADAAGVSVSTIYEYMKGEK